MDKALQPNILLLTTDQQRYDTIAAMGYPYMVTPNLDRLVREGCAVPLAHSPNPARNHNGFGRMELMEEMPRYRQDDDYATYLDEVGEGTIQSIHGVRNVLQMLPQKPLQAQQHTGTQWVANRLVYHLRQNAGKRPFFYWGSWIAPHPPFSVPQQYANLYQNKELPKAILPTGNPKPHTLANSRTADFYDDAVARRAREYYYGAITWVDEQIGRVLDALDAIGQLDNTLIIFTSDHGEMLGDHGSYQKFQPYEGSVRIPFVMRYPQRIKAGGVFDGFADLNDILPTVLDAANLEYPAGYQLPGGSLLEGGAKGKKNREIQYTEHSHGAKRWVSLRSKEYKYVYYYTGGMEELFDIEQDPDETVNLLERDKDNYLTEYDRMKKALLQEELHWGHKGGVQNGQFIAKGEYAPRPGLPATFPIFPKNLPEGEAMLTLAEEIHRAIVDELAVNPVRLRWDEWIGEGYITPDIRDAVFKLHEEC